MLKLLTAAAVFSTVWIMQAQMAFRTPQEAARYYEDLIGNLTQQVRSIQDENAKLSGTVFNLQRQTRALEESQQLMLREIQDLRKQLAAEKEARNKQLSNVADRLQAAGKASAEPANTPAAEGNYDIYEVQPGATLSAISRKSGISVSEIMKANNMTSANLRVGQKLKIPRK